MGDGVRSGSKEWGKKTKARWEEKRAARPGPQLSLSLSLSRSLSLCRPIPPSLMPMHTRTHKQMHTRSSTQRHAHAHADPAHHTLTLTLDIDAQGRCLSLWCFSVAEPPRREGKLGAVALEAFARQQEDLFVALRLRPPCRAAAGWRACRIGSGAL